MKLRQAKTRDLTEILQVAASTKVFSPDEAKCLFADFEAWDESVSSDRLDTDRFYVAEHEGAIVGFAQWGPLDITERSWMLHWIAVHRKAQGTGIGKDLMKRVEKDARRRAARILFIETSSREQYAATRAFYMKAGYFPVSVIPDYYSYGDAKVVFSKQLGDLCVSKA